MVALSLLCGSLSLLYGSLSLLCGSLSLVYGCFSLLCGCLSLLYGWWLMEDTGVGGGGGRCLVLRLLVCWWGVCWGARVFEMYAMVLTTHICSHKQCLGRWPGVSLRLSPSQDPPPHPPHTHNIQHTPLCLCVRTVTCL
jgi:hypothetical protein